MFLLDHFGPSQPTTGETLNMLSAKLNKGSDEV